MYIQTDGPTDKYSLTLSWPTLGGQLKIEPKSWFLPISGLKGYFNIKRHVLKLGQIETSRYLWNQGIIPIMSELIMAHMQIQFLKLNNTLSSFLECMRLQTDIKPVTHAFLNIDSRVQLEADRLLPSIATWLYCEEILEALSSLWLARFSKQQQLKKFMYV